MSESQGILKYLKIAVFVLAGISVLLMAGLFWLRYSVRRGMTNAEIAEMERFFAEPVTLPQEWRTIEPFPAELVGTRDELQDAYTAATSKGKADRFDWSIRYLPSERIIRGERPGEEEWDRLARFVEQFRPCGQAARTLSAAPGYDLNVITHNTPGVNVCMYVTAQYLWAEGCLHAREGRWREAFEDALVSMRLARRHPASRLGVHSHGLAIESGGARLVGYVAQQCDDPETLRWVLEEMNRLQPDLDINISDNIRLIDIVGDLRWFARQGAVVDLDSTAPGSYFFNQVIDLYRGSGMLAGASWKERTAARYSGRFLTSAELMYRHTLFQGVERWKRDELKTAAEFDLARFEIARRIEELENGGEIPPPEDLVKKYFAEGLDDPFSPGNPYRWYKRGKYFYSVGPSRARGGGKAPVMTEGEPGPDAIFLPRVADDTEPETAQ